MSDYDNIDLTVNEDSDGWWWVYIDCSPAFGPFPDRETATDELIYFVSSQP